MQRMFDHVAKIRKEKKRKREMRNFHNASKQMRDPHGGVITEKPIGINRSQKDQKLSE